VSRSPRVRDLVAGPQLDSEASRQHSIATRDHVTYPRTFLRATKLAERPRRLRLARA